MSFDLLHRGGRDLRREPIEVRKATPAKLLREAKSGIELSEHLQGGGPNCVAKPKRIGVGRRALRLIGAQVWRCRRNHRCGRSGLYPRYPQRPGACVLVVSAD